MLNMDKYIEIQNRVADYIGRTSVEKKVIFSAYEDDKDGAIDNLDKVPIEGKVIFIREKDSFALAPYQSELFENPTWLEICGSANDAIIQTGDYHHVFLEDVYVEREEEDGVKIAKLIMGS